MRTVDEHRAAVAALLPPTPVEAFPLSEALGLVLAEDLRAGVSLPPFDNSAMDGYAVRARDVAGATERAPCQLPVAEDIPAGRTDGPPLRPGTAHRIMTGAPLPPGADAVVPVEHTDGGTRTVRIERAPEVGAHVRRAGEDVEAGSVVLPAGTLLGPAQLGVAAAVGAATVPARRRPHVLVLSTGSELVAPNQPLRHGQIYESNGVMLASAVVDAGGRATQLHFVPDDVDQLLAVLDEQVRAGVDLILTSGGVSAGAYEVVKDALAPRGVEFDKVAMQPGGPQGAGRVIIGRTDNETAVVTLPGNPVSSQVSFEVFVRPALRAAMGHPHPDRPVARGRLSEPLQSRPGVRQFRRGNWDPVTQTVRPVGGPGSHLLAAMARSNCLFVLDEERDEYTEGEPVEVWLLER